MNNWIYIYISNYIHVCNPIISHYMAIWWDAICVNQLWFRDSIQPTLRPPLVKDQLGALQGGCLPIIPLENHQISWCFWIFSHFLYRFCCIPMISSSNGLFSLTWWIFPWKKPIDDIFPSNIIKWKLMIWMKSPRGWIHYKRICIYISNIILNGNMDEMMKCFFPYHRPSLISSIDFTDYIIDISPVKYEY